MRFLLSITAIIWSACVGGAYLYETRAEEDHARTLAFTQARMVFNQVTNFRAWISRYGGVYVPSDTGSTLNLHLPVERREMTSTDGRAWTLVTPATATREIGEIARDREGLKTRISSLKPLGANNAPSAWERDALERFEAGDDEYGAFVERDGQWTFRYMAPLIVEASCMECHRQQGYKLGDVRGGISVEAPANEIMTMAQHRHAVASALAAVVWILGLVVLALIDRWVASRQRLIRRLRDEALLDSLTGLHNRRGFDTLAVQQLELADRNGTHAALLFMDVDNFKTINDTYGHRVGDEVLKCVAEALRETFRKSDVIARLGGDEFVVMTQGDGPESIDTMVQRLSIRLEMVKRNLSLEPAVTVSVGTSTFDPDEPSLLEDMLSVADARMYESKPAAPMSHAR